MTTGWIPTLLVLIPSLPLLAAIATALFGRGLLRDNMHLPTVVALVCSFVASLTLLFEVRSLDDMRSLDAGAMIGWETTGDVLNWLAVPSAIAPPAAARPSAAAAALPATLPFNINVTLRAYALTAIML